MAHHIGKVVQDKFYCRSISEKIKVHALVDFAEDFTIIDSFLYVVKDLFVELRLLSLENHVEPGACDFEDLGHRILSHEYDKRNISEKIIEGGFSFPSTKATN